MENRQTGTLARYSCEDFYMTGPHQWWGFFGPEHGVEWLIETRGSEIAHGDTLCALPLNSPRAFSFGPTLVAPLLGRPVGWRVTVYQPLLRAEPVRELRCIWARVRT